MSDTQDQNTSNAVAEPDTADDASTQASTPASTPASTDASPDTADASAREDHLEQSVTVSDSGPARKTLTIEIPQSRVKEKFEEAYGRLQSDAALPGFRKGRAPRQLIEKRFGTSLREEVRGQLLSESYNQALRENDLEPLGEPEVKDLEKIELPTDGPLTFRVEVEVSPKVDLPDFTSLDIDKVAADVADDAVEVELARMRDRMGKMNEVSDPEAKVQAEDYLLADARIDAGEHADGPPQEGEPLEERAGVYVLIHGENHDFKGHVLGIVVDDLGKRLIDRSPGDRISIPATGPGGHENELIRDQPITITLQLHSIHRLEPAALEQVVQNSGHATEEDLRSRMKEVVTQRAVQEARQKMQAQVMEQLMERVELELPEGLTNQQVARQVTRREAEVRYGGGSEEEIQAATADARTTGQEQARKQLKSFFILDQASRQLNVDVTDEELNMQVYQIALRQQRRFEKVRQDLQARGQLEGIYLQIREQKTLAAILQAAGIDPASSETSPDEAGSEDGAEST